MHRDEMVGHVYDTTYEVVNKGKDTLVVIDDSIYGEQHSKKVFLECSTASAPRKSS